MSKRSIVPDFSDVNARLLLFIVVLLVVVPGRSADEPAAFDFAGSFTNGLGMRFVPVPGIKAHFSVYQTRVKDFRVFMRETGYVHMRETSDPDSRMWSLDKDGGKQRGHSWEDPGFAQSEDHPVVGVSWLDAKAFCEWLTLRERAGGRLPADREYPLPKDNEWSVAVGLHEEDSAQTPAEKDGGIVRKFPWGPAWPPPAGAGNYAGEEASGGHWPAKFSFIAGYNDGYPRTAPVGSFKPNRYGIYDLGSNVLERCEDVYRPGASPRVLRGASWFNNVRDDLLSSRRSNDPPGRRYDSYGFRCVVGSFSP